MSKSKVVVYEPLMENYYPTCLVGESTKLRIRGHVSPEGLALTNGKEYEVIEEVSSEYTEMVTNGLKTWFNPRIVKIKIKDDNGKECMLDENLFMVKPYLINDEIDESEYSAEILKYIKQPFEINRELYKEADVYFLSLYDSLNECLCLCGLLEDGEVDNGLGILKNAIENSLLNKVTLYEVKKLLSDMLEQKRKDVELLERLEKEI